MPRVPKAVEGGLGRIRVQAPNTPTLSQVRGGGGSGGFQALSAGMARFTAELEKAEKEAQLLRNKALLLETQRKAKIWAVQQTTAYTNPESGVFGRNADKDWVNSQGESFNQMAMGMLEDKAYNDLDEAGQIAVRAALQDVALSHYQSVMTHHNKQLGEAVKAERTANINLLRDEIAANPVQFNAKFDVLASYVADEFNDAGLQDEKILRNAMKAELSTTVKQTVVNLVDAQQFSAAKAFLTQHKAHKVKGLKGDVKMDADTEQDLRTLIVNASEDQRAASIAQEMLSKGGSRSSMTNAVRNSSLPQSTKDKVVSRINTLISERRADVTHARNMAYTNAVLLANQGKEIPASMMNLLDANKQKAVRLTQHMQRMEQRFPDNPPDPSTVTWLDTRATAASVAAMPDDVYNATLLKLSETLGQRSRLRSLRLRGLEAVDAAKAKAETDRLTEAQKSRVDRRKRFDELRERALKALNLKESDPEYNEIQIALESMEDEAGDWTYTQMLDTIRPLLMNRTESGKMLGTDERLAALFSDIRENDRTDEQQAIVDIKNRYPNLIPDVKTYGVATDLYRAYYKDDTDPVTSEKMGQLLSLLQSTGKPLPKRFDERVRKDLIAARTAAGKSPLVTDSQVRDAFVYTLMQGILAPASMIEWLGHAPKP